MISTNPSPSTLALALGFTSFSALLYRWWTTPSHRLPPGPKRLPVIGNVFDIPKDFAWITYQKWSKEYDSDVIHVDALGTHLIVVNSAKAANEIFEKRSSIYSDRPAFVTMKEILKMKWAMGFTSYGADWRRLRKAFHQHFQPVASEQYHPIEARATLDLLQRLLHTPQDFIDHIRHMAGRTILEITYGIEVQPQNDYYIKTVEKALDAMTFGSSPRANVFETFPILTRLPDWLPGMSLKREAKEWIPSCIQVAEAPFRAVKEAVANGTAIESVTSSLLRDSEDEKSPWDEDIAKRVPAAMLFGGADTTLSAITTFMLTMVLYPEIQRKAHAEIDAIIGHDRLPIHSDEDLLPYVGAVVKEVLRWSPIAPLAIPHSVMSDDIYEGYFIPAGSIVLGNCWAILHDESVYPDPYVFKPERFLGPDNTATTNFPDAAFGFGRRVCPGRFMAHASTWLAITSILATFEISKDVDESGNEIVPTGEYLSGPITHPVPFKCSIKPRSHAAETLIQTASI